MRIWDIYLPLQESSYISQHFSRSASFFDHQTDIVELPAQQRKTVSLYQCFSRCECYPFRRSWNQFYESQRTFFLNKIKCKISECLYESFARIMHVARNTKVSFTIWKDIWWGGYDEQNVHEENGFSVCLLITCLVFIIRRLIVQPGFMLPWLATGYQIWDVQLRFSCKLLFWGRCYLGYKYIYIWVSGNYNILFKNCF